MCLLFYEGHMNIVLSLLNTSQFICSLIMCDKLTIFCISASDNSVQMVLYDKCALNFSMHDFNAM